MDQGSNSITAIYRLLLSYYGEQHWWPAQDHFEVMVGAILTQNTAWTNVEKAITDLKQNGLCNSEALAQIEQQRLAELIRPSGYFNQKAERLKLFANWYQLRGGYESLKQLALEDIRSALLELKGIGEETADDMVLYAFNKPSFVIDSYTRRIFSRLGLCKGCETYHQLQLQFQQHLNADVDIFKQYHALIVSHAKRHCRKKPDCEACPLALHCCHEHIQKKT